MDYEEYAFHQDFFYGVCQDFNCTPMVDLFANNANKKVDKFFSLTYCPNTMGVDAFNYDWSKNGLNWIFAAPRLILRIIHLQLTRAEALLLVPQWKTSYFYPFLHSYRFAKRNQFMGVMVFSLPELILKVIWEPRIMGM